MISKFGAYTFYLKMPQATGQSCSGSVKYTGHKGWLPKVTGKRSLTGTLLSAGVHLLSVGVLLLSVGVHLLSTGVHPLLVRVHPLSVRVHPLSVGVHPLSVEVHLSVGGCWSTLVGVHPLMYTC